MGKPKEYKAPFFIDDIDRIMFAMCLVMPTAWAIGGTALAIWFKS